MTIRILETIYYIEGDKNILVPFYNSLRYSSSVLHTYKEICKGFNIDIVEEVRSALAGYIRKTTFHKKDNYIRMEMRISDRSEAVFRNFLKSIEGLKLYYEVWYHDHEDSNQYVFSTNDKEFKHIKGPYVLKEGRRLEYIKTLEELCSRISKFTITNCRTVKECNEAIQNAYVNNNYDDSIDYSRYHRLGCMVAGEYKIMEE